MHGGAADRSGLIFPGDEVVEVNGMSVESKTPDDVLQMLKNSEGTITFKLIPVDSLHHKVIQPISAYLLKFVAWVFYVFGFVKEISLSIALFISVRAKFVCDVSSILKQLMTHIFHAKKLGLIL